MQPKCAFMGAGGLLIAITYLNLRDCSINSILLEYK